MTRAGKQRASILSNANLSSLVERDKVQAIRKPWCQLPTVTLRSLLQNTSLGWGGGSLAKSDCSASMKTRIGIHSMDVKSQLWLCTTVFPCWGWRETQAS